MTPHRLADRLISPGTGLRLGAAEDRLVESLEGLQVVAVRPQQAPGAVPMARIWAA